MLPPDEAVEWVPSAGVPVPWELVGVVALGVDGLVVLGGLFAFGPLGFLGGLRALAPWFLAGPVAGLGYGWANRPRAIGLTPRAVVVRFPFHRLVAPWSLVEPVTSARGGGAPSLRFVHPSQPTSVFVGLSSSQAEAILRNPGAAEWGVVARARRAWDGSVPPSARR